MSHFYRSEIYGSHFLLLIVLLDPMSLLTGDFASCTEDGGNITWLEPPPFETVTDASSISRTNKSVIQGSLNEELSCNFSLSSDLRIGVVAMKFRSRPAVTFVPNVFLRVERVFAKRLNAVWVPNKLTLIFSNVTDAEEGEYSCQVVTIGKSARTWIRKIQLLVVDPMAMVFSITFDQNPIQATVSAITASEVDPIQTTVSGVTASEGPILTKDSITASEADVPWGIIAAVVGVAYVIAIAIAIAMVCLLKRRKRAEKVHHVDLGGNEGVDMQVQAGNALSGPLAADGINGSQSKRNIHG